MKNKLSNRAVVREKCIPKFLFLIATRQRRIEETAKIELSIQLPRPLRRGWRSKEKRALVPKEKRISAKADRMKPRFLFWAKAHRSGKTLTPR